ncbi:MAG: FtsQ-type POTRA domain-containing protein [Gammaproteobacteria bacterium]|nr:FtsQ-type POTRA domain-containing protein [Gammaproteobacteria bacterium]
MNDLENCHKQATYKTSDKHGQKARSRIRRLPHNVKVSLLLGIIVCLPAALLSWLLDPRTQAIDTVGVEGRHKGMRVPLRHIKPEMVRGVITEWTARGFFNIDTEAIQNALRALPWVKDAAARRVWPGELQVSIREHVAVARWLVATELAAAEAGPENEQICMESSVRCPAIDEEGKLFYPPASDLSADLPLLEGPHGSHTAVLRRYQTASLILQGENLKVRHMKYNARRAWQAILNNGLKLLLGREESKRPLRRFIKVYRHISGNGRKIIYADLRYTNGIAVRYGRTE